MWNLGFSMRSARYQRGFKEATAYTMWRFSQGRARAGTAQREG